MLKKLLLLLCVAFSLRADVLIKNVRVFDGVRVQNATDVLIRDGKIAGIGKLSIKDAEIVDGTGKTQR
jgi:dihydroorotase-like cyclic amidohydrolase